jgi:hypothetical protein
MIISRMAALYIRGVDDTDSIVFSIPSFTALTVFLGRLLGCRIVFSIGELGANKSLQCFEYAL